MTKNQMLANLAAVYNAANMSDSDNPARPDWLDVRACADICGRIDDILQSASFDHEDRAEFYGNRLA